ncbi:MAG: response regulator [Verrucomicrobiota bacterium]
MQSKATTALPSGSDRKATESPSKRQILLIDDDVAFTSLVKRLLEDEEGGYQVVPLHDSNAAEDEARNLKPDVVVADIIMAPRDGAEVFVSFQEDPELSDIPFIIMSAFLNNRVFPDSPLDLGAHDVLEKPMNLSDLKFLIERIEKELEKRQKKSGSA